MTMHVAARLFACILALGLVAPSAAAAPAAPTYAQTVSWLLHNYPRDVVMTYPQTIAIAGCALTVRRRPDHKTDVTTQVDLRAAQVLLYAGPGSPHVDLLTAGVFPVHFRFADGSTSTGATTSVVLGTTRRGDQAARLASAFERLRGSCGRKPTR